LDDTKTDFFSVYFPFWVTRIDTSYLKFSIKVIATLEVCDSIAENPIAVNGYYPLYYTAESANNAGDGTSHTHVLNSVTYYMPNGVQFWHGDYIAYSPAFQTHDNIEIQYIETDPYQIEFIFNETKAPTTHTHTPTTHTHTPTTHTHVHRTFDDYIIIMMFLPCIILFLSFIALAWTNNKNENHHYHHIYK
jgi:hypothetical protein